MTKIHNQISRGSLSAALKKALGIVKSEGGIERFGETLTPGVNLWDLDVPEWSYLRDDTLGALLLSSAAVAAEFSFVALTLPDNSPNLLIIERVNARFAGNVQIGSQARSVIAATGTLSGTVSQCRDQRFAKGTAVARNPPVEVWFGSDPGSITGGLTEQLETSATAYEEFISPPHIVKPGGGLVCQGGVVNIILTTNWVFRVRAALAGELD